MVESSPTMRARPDDGENALGARRRDHADLEQALLDAIAAVARIAGEEQHLVGGELHRLGIGEQLRRQASPETPRTDWQVMDPASSPPHAGEVLPAER